MHAKLKLLGELQEVDLKIDGLQGEKQKLLAGVDLLEQKIAGVQSEVAVKNEELSQVELERGGIDESLAAESDNITRSEGRLKEIKTQKEFQAVSKEISTAKKLKTELEDQLLKKIADIEELRKEIAEKEEGLASMLDEVQTERQEFEQKIALLDKEIEGGASVREQVTKGLPSSLLRRYSQLREQRRGVAVVEARDGSCLGCNMNLPPQLYNTLFRCDDIITCPHCQRVLLLKQDG